MTLVDRLAVARGDKPAELVLRNVQLVNVISGEIYPTDVMVHETYVVGLGEGYEAEQGNRPEWKICLPRLYRRACAYRK